ncbi:MAG: methyltransferase domain-containing protein [Thermoplasmata archaeon]|nr:MAG: methyltransferase domain-containing protein [Thermoplasmata archaeon]
MKEDTLNLLHCPDCNSAIELRKVYNKIDNEYIDAVVGCDCTEYPILDGILIYKKPSSHDGMSSTAYLIERMKAGYPKDAKALPLKRESIENSLLNLHIFLSSLGPLRRSISPILTLVRRRKRRLYDKLTNKLSFFDIIDMMEPNTWGDYLKHRFSSQTLWSLYPFIHMIERKDDRVLDLGCGAGHASFILSKHIKPQNLVCADENYTMLFLAKKIMVKDANFICMDANNPLPFSKDTFSSIIMMDSFHYVSNRAQLARECERILKQNGALLLLHLHNALKENISRGYPLSPSAWSALFKDLNTCIVPESHLIEDFMQKSELDLTKKYNDEIINNADAISIAGTLDDELIGKYENLDQYIKKMQNPIINPIYDFTRNKDKIMLKRNPPNDVFLTEYPLTKKFLPEKYSVPYEISKTLKGRKVGISRDMLQKNKTFYDMIRKFIIIDSPKGYV